MRVTLFFFTSLFCLFAVQAKQQKIIDLPLIHLENFQYSGAFRFPADSYGDSSLVYAESKIAYNPSNNSLFIMGKTKQQAIAEFSIPKLNLSKNLAPLETATALQNFTFVFKSPHIKNPQKINRVTGMIALDDELFVNAIKYYDARAKNTHTSLVISNSSKIDPKNISGFYSLQGASHAAGWVSVIPKEWRSKLQGDFITGNASNTPIAARHSIGPSAFVITKPDFTEGPPQAIATTPIIDFNLKHKLADDFYNEAGKNKLWNVVSRAEYGFIVPNTKTYAVFGSSGGHHSKLGYKIQQKDGRRCPGPCAFDPLDYYNYYWLFNVEDMLAVFAGKKLAYQVRPYQYGKFKIPFDTSQTGDKPQEFHRISGGSFDANSSILYLTLKKADNSVKNQPLPIAVAYQVALK